MPDPRFTAARRRRLLDALYDLPLTDTIDGRSSLVDYLDPRLLFDFSRSTRKIAHLDMIIDYMQSRVLPDGRPGLLFVLDTALKHSKDTETEAELQALRAELFPSASGHSTTSRQALPAPTPLKLSGAQRKQLLDALIQAFPTWPSLARVVDFHLDTSLDTIASGHNLADAAFELIRWAIAHDKIVDLMQGAIAENPSNLALRSVADEILTPPIVTPAPPPPPIINTPPPDTSILPTSATPRLRSAIYVPRPLADVPPDHPDYARIQCIVAQGVMDTYPCGGPDEPCDPNNDPYFRPDAAWEGTRGETAKLLSLAACFNDPLPDTQQTYTDVPPTSSYWVYIERMDARKILTGYYDSLFRPENDITRAQFVKVLSGAVGFTDQVPKNQQTFEDVPPSHAFWLFIERLVNHDVINSTPCGGPDEPCNPPFNRPYFHPFSNMNTVTRAEVASILARAFFPDCQPADAPSLTPDPSPR